MEEAHDTENDNVDDANENERPPQPEIQADGIQPRSQTNPNANENQHSLGSELAPKNGSNANNESLAASSKDKDSSPLSPDPDQERFQTLEPIKMSFEARSLVVLRAMSGLQAHFQIDQQPPSYL